MFISGDDSSSRGIGQRQMRDRELDTGGCVCSGDIKDWSVDIHGEVIGPERQDLDNSKGTDR